MKVSVIVPYYNPDSSPALEQLLARAVLSARDNLTDIPHEIIIVNDGSPSDPTVPSAPDVIYIRREHGMLGAARNTGIDNATGNVICFLDADDFYYPKSLAPCLAIMEQAQADLLAFGMVRTAGTDTASTPAGGKPQYTGPMTGNGYMRLNNLPGSACRYLISMSLIRDCKLRFMENAFIEDEEFTPRLMHFSKRYVETSYPVYAYCVREGSIITSDTSALIQAKSDDTLKAIGNLITFREQHLQEPHEGLDRKISFLAMDLMRRTLRRKDWKEAIQPAKESLRALGLYPFKCGGYPFKFRVFSILSRNRAGLWLLHLIEKRYI